MRTDLLDRYALLYARKQSAGIAFDYADERSGEIECGTEGLAEGKTSFGISGFFAASLGNQLTKILASMPMQNGPHGTGLVPLAVFVGGGENMTSLPPPFTLTDLAVEALANAFSFNPDQFQGVVLPRRDWPSRAPFTLPLRVGATSSLLYDLLRDTQAGSWYANDPFVSTQGLTFEQITAEKVIGEWPDVLFLSTPAELQRLTDLPQSKRPRLVVACGFSPLIEEPALGVSSCLVLEAIPPPPFVEALIYALIHDQPLHEMLKSALRTVPFPAHLVADPASVEQLRMLQAMQELENDAAELEASGYVAPAPSDESPFDLMRALRLDCGQESDALVPMSRARAALQRLRSATNGRRALEVLDEEAPRQVDITLLRTDPRSGQRLYVEPTTSLGAARPYRVKVRIGLRSRASLVIGEVPPIDTLLPPPTGGKGHLLHIVCYPLDFEAVGPTIRRLILPLEGSSKAVSFDVIAPRGIGPARLRVAVYYDADLSTDSLDEADAYRNHLIQSFLLQTEVTTYDGSNSTTAVTLEFSRTAGYASLDQYTARVASIAVNEAPDGTHQLMMKRGGMHRSFSLNQLLLQKSVTEMREKLFDATALDAAAQFPRFLDGAPENEPMFDDVIRDLAKAGAAMRQKIFADPSTDTSKLLTAIAGTADEIVQVVRLHNDFYFPWQVLYDFEPPDEIFGAPPPPV